MSQQYRNNTIYAAFSIKSSSRISASSFPVKPNPFTFTFFSRRSSISLFRRSRLFSASILSSLLSLRESCFCQRNKKFLSLLNIRVLPVKICPFLAYRPVWFYFQCIICFWGAFFFSGTKDKTPVLPYAQNKYLFR